MHLDLLLDIIQKGVNELKKVTDNYSISTPSPLEIDIATSKTQTLLKELQLLKEKVFDTGLATKTGTILSNNNNKCFKSQKQKSLNPVSINMDRNSVHNKIEEKTIGESISTSKNLTDLININDKFQFIIELFNNNSTLYYETINKLNTVSSFENAKKIISSFNWNEEEETVLHFIEILTRKFNHNV